MKKSVLAGAVAAGLLSTSAFAADLPNRKTARLPGDLCGPFTWTGFYVGLNAGYGWSSGTDVTVTGGGATTLFSGGDEGGFTGGAQAGYNFQTGAIVFGLEDGHPVRRLRRRPHLRAVPRDDRQRQLLGFGPWPLGFAADRALFYVTGGLAYGDIGERVFGNNDVRAGWALGGGVEYAFTNNGPQGRGPLCRHRPRQQGRAITTNGVVYTATQSSDSGFGVVRAGLNYKF